jgi:hypothetical protein
LRHVLQDFSGRHFSTLRPLRPPLVSQGSHTLQAEMLKSARQGAC